MWGVSGADDHQAGAPEEPLLDGLNPAQHEAVTHPEGPLLVVAGAGSGKTRVLTHRIAHLIRDEGVSPFEILAITFTNKAAGEMRERVARLVGPVAQKMWISTFHSACVRILRRDAHLLGYPSQFTIYDQADAVRLTGYVIRDLELNPKQFQPRSVHARISAAKNEGLSAADFAESASVITERKIAEVFTEYQARLRAAGAMDFDDLLSVTVELFRIHPEVLDHYRQRFRHVLVDEYQDTNPVQNDLVMLLGEEHRNVCIVGDTDQSIYAFRAADIRNILEFETHLPRCHRGGARTELPLHPDDPGCGQRGHRQQRAPQAQGALVRLGSWRSDRARSRARTRPTRPNGSPTRLRRSTNRATCVGATWRSSTAQTPRVVWWRNP